jgi:hypothetical protein
MEMKIEKQLVMFDLGNTIESIRRNGREILELMVSGG